MQPIGAFVQLVEQQAGQCLAVTGASLTQGAQVVQTSCATADRQLWSLVAQSGSYALKAKHSGQCLDVTAASQADAAPLIQWPCTAQPNQTFQFERRLFAPPSALSIVGAQSGQCVNVDGGFATAGTAAIHWPCAGPGNDTWTLRPIGQAVSIVSSLSG